MGGLCRDQAQHPSLAPPCRQTSCQTPPDSLPRPPLWSLVPVRWPDRPLETTSGPVTHSLGSQPRSLGALPHHQTCIQGLAELLRGLSAAGPASIPWSPVSTSCGPGGGSVHSADVTALGDQNYFCQRSHLSHPFHRHLLSTYQVARAVLGMD